MACYVPHFLTPPEHVLRWHDGTVPRIARGIEDGLAFDRLPILADALLDAGCDDECLIAGCRAGDRRVLPYCGVHPQ
jgi:hypothetical protein